MIDAGEQFRCVVSSLARVCMAIAPCPTAGRKSCGSRMRGAASARSSRFNPAERQHGRVHRAVIDFAQPRFDIAAQGDDLEIGAQPFHLRGARSDAVPSFAPFGKSESVAALRLMKASRTSSRGRQAATINPSGSNVVRSLAE